MRPGSRGAAYARGLAAAAFAIAAGLWDPVHALDVGSAISRAAYGVVPAPAGQPSAPATPKSPGQQGLPAPASPEAAGPTARPAPTVDVRPAPSPATSSAPERAAAVPDHRPATAHPDIQPAQTAEQAGPALPEGHAAAPPAMTETAPPAIGPEVGMRAAEARPETLPLPSANAARPPAPSNVGTMTAPAPKPLPSEAVETGATWVTEIAPPAAASPEDAVGHAGTAPQPSPPSDQALQAVPAAGSAEPPPAAMPSPLPTIVPAALSAGSPVAAPGSWDVLRSGDMLEIRFYRNSAMQAHRYQLAPGDVIRIDVVDHPDISRETVTVLPDGYISAPLAGSVEAAGKTIEEVRAALTERYSAARLLNPDVSVAVVQADQRIDSLVRPDPSGSSPGMRITVSQMGDLDLPFIPPVAANRALGEVQRDIKAAYRKVFGDRLEVTANLVEHAAPVVYVAGQVTKPTEVPLVAPLTPVSAIAAAGGFLPQASPKNVHVIRFRPDGSYQDWKFNLDHDLKKGDATAVTFRLQPQDVVFVPKSGIAKADEFVEQYIRGLMPIPLSVGYGF